MRPTFTKPPRPVDRPEMNEYTSHLSILSHRHAAPLLLDSFACILFAGTESDSDRFAIWPTAKSCNYIPAWTKPLQERSYDISGDPETDINSIKSFIKGEISGKFKPVNRNRSRGPAQWLVEVGQEILPCKPILRIGTVTYLSQPLPKQDANVKIFVANRLIEPGTECSRLPRGYPLLVAVHDPIYLPRYKNYVPDMYTLRQLGSNYRAGMQL